MAEQIWNSPGNLKYLDFKAIPNLLKV